MERGRAASIPAAVSDEDLRCFAEVLAHDSLTDSSSSASSAESETEWNCVRQLAASLLGLCAGTPEQSVSDDALRFIAEQLCLRLRDGSLLVVTEAMNAIMDAFAFDERHEIYKAAGMHAVLKAAHADALAKVSPPQMAHVGDILHTCVGDKNSNTEPSAVPSCTIVSPCQPTLQSTCPLTQAPVCVWVNVPLCSYGWRSATLTLKM